MSLMFHQLKVYLVFLLSTELEWNQVPYHCDHLLAYFTSPGWEIIVEKLVEGIPNYPGETLPKFRSVHHSSHIT
jgi:hypothetical protein